MNKQKIKYLIFVLLWFQWNIFSGYWVCSITTYFKYQLYCVFVNGLWVLMNICLSYIKKIKTVFR